jgi:hypothetical protein
MPAKSNNRLQGVFVMGNTSWSLGSSTNSLMTRSQLFMHGGDKRNKLWLMSTGKTTSTFSESREKIETILEYKRWRAPYHISHEQMKFEIHDNFALGSLLSQIFALRGDISQG